MGSIEMPDRRKFKEECIGPKLAEVAAFWKAGESPVSWELLRLEYTDTVWLAG
jgi:hypothetical protein